MAKRHHSNDHQIVRYEFSGTIHWQILYGYFQRLATEGSPPTSHMERSAFEQIEMNGLTAQLTLWYTTSQKEKLERFVESTLSEYLLALRAQRCIKPTDDPIKIRSRKKVDSIG